MEGQQSFSIYDLESYSGKLKEIGTKLVLETVSLNGLIWTGHTDHGCKLKLKIILCLVLVLSCRNVGLRQTARW